ncbi:MAG: molybdenum cofactor guanylyltransferase [Methylacidiphilales bacterium]|nr:molybdenum cofactor guanylyltransferase [Candidatus Methylacidiphilales bacterium]
MQTSFTAGLLAGGRSSRMGRDKAALEFEGEMLWQRQVRLLESLNPSQLLISGRPDGPYIGSSYKVIYDQHADQGPLAGLAALLRACVTPRLLVLAVDMPWMTSSVLKQMLVHKGGVVIEHDGLWEGTAAVYPIEILSLVEDALAGPDHSLQSLIRRAKQAGLMETCRIPPAQADAFRSWNTPHPPDAPKKLS